MSLLSPSKQGNIYSQEELSSIKEGAIPTHIAIIPDGNRRWAKLRGEALDLGHWRGADILFDVVKAAKEIGIQVVTTWGFSTENWSRSPEEVDAVMEVIQAYLINRRDDMVEEGVRLRSIGKVDALPEDVRTAYLASVEATKNCKDIQLNLALNYGGRDDILRGVKELIKEGVDPSKLTEEILSAHLDSSGLPDPDLLIRTSGEMRISNFMLWQLSYSEIFVADVLWPDFTPSHLLSAVRAYQERDRRYGGS